MSETSNSSWTRSDNAKLKLRKKIAQVSGYTSGLSLRTELETYGNICGYDMLRLMFVQKRQCQHHLCDRFILKNLCQGGHRLWKTGKMAEKNSLQGKIREFEILSKIRELSGNFTKMERKIKVITSNKLNLSNMHL